MPTRQQLRQLREAGPTNEEIVRNKERVERVALETTILDAYVAETVEDARTLIQNGVGGFMSLPL